MYLNLHKKKNNGSDMKKYILLLAFILSSLNLFAVDNELFGVNNMGRNFIFTVPPCIETDSPFDNKVLLYVSSPYRTWVNINVDAPKIHFSVQILPNQTEVIELPAYEVVPYSKGIIDIETNVRTFKDYAIKINAENPVSLVASVRFNQSSDAFTVLPQETLGTEYILSSYNDASGYYPSISSLSSVSGIVIPYDNTQLEVIIGGNEETIITGFKKAGDTLRAILNSGDVYMLPTMRNRADLSGTTVKATKPVAVITGNQNANIPLENGNSDYIANMELPVSTWGKEYLVPYSAERKYSPVVRVFAKEPNTNVYINGELHTTLSCATNKVDDRFFETRIYNDLSEKSAAYIRADKPISVTMYNTGVKEDGLPEKLGGPYSVSLAPIRQFQKHILLPMIENYDPYEYDSYRMSLLVPEGISLDDIQVGIKDNKDVLWNSITSFCVVNKTDDFFPTINATTYKLYDLDLNISESFYLKASLPFMAYIRGTSQHEAYGVGAAYGMKSDKFNDHLPPVPTWTMDCNGDVTGTVIDFPSDKEEASCLFPPMPIRDSIDNYSFDCEAIPSKDVLSIKWSLKINNPNNKASAQIQFIDNAGNDTIITIEYEPVILAFNPNKIDFGILEVGDEVEEEVELQNQSSLDAIIDDVMLKGLVPGYEIENSPAPFILPAGASELLKIKFTAKEPGEYADSLGIQDTCKSFYALYALSRVGFAKIDANDADLGDILSGKEASQLVRVYNRGTTKLVIGGVKLPSNPDITVELPKIPSVTDPITIIPHTYMDYRIKINSTSMVEYRDSVVFYSNSIPEADSVTYIDALSLQPGILSENFDFGRKTKGYEYGTNNGGIKIENSGNTSITISDIILENDNSDGAFKFDKQVVCKTINKGESLYLPVKFKPVDTGYYTLDLKYKLSDGTISKSVTKLSGTGVVAKLQSNKEEIDLGVALINSATDIKKAKVTITNLSTSEWEFADRVVITGLTPIDNSIGMGKSNFSNKGFAIDDSNLDLNTELLPGEELSFFVYFRAFALNSSASLKVENDADLPLIIKFKGKGVEELVAVNSEPVAACYGTEEQFDLEVINSGSTDISFEAPSFTEASSEFYFAGTASEFTVSSGEVYKIPINYRPKSRDALSAAKVEIHAKNGSAVSLTKEVTGKAVNIDREVAMQPLSVVVPIGKKTSKTVKLLSGEDISALDIKRLHIKVSYLSNFLLVERESVKLNKDLEGYFDLQNIQIDNDNGTIEADIVSISNKFIDNGINLMDIDFDTFLSTIETTKSNINVELSSPDSECVLFNSITGVIELQPYCAGDISKILINGTHLEAPKVNPNPISTDKFELSFSLGYDADITLEIVDVNGKLIKTVLAGNYKAGEYRKEISTEEIPAGVYFIKLQSATMYLSEKLVIVK